MTCIPSRIGLIPFQNESLRAARIPRGTPMMTHMRTATMIIPSVSIVRSQYWSPSSAAASKAAALPSPTRKLRVATPIKKNNNNTTGHGIQVWSRSSTTRFKS